MRNELGILPTRPVDFRHRYSISDLSCLTDAERRRFLAGADPDPQTNPAIAWELLYRLEPELYDRLIKAERIHRAVVDWLPRRVPRIVEVGAGNGRLTTDLVNRCDELIAIEPAAPLRERLSARLAAAGQRLRVLDGFFDDLPVADRSANLVVACSAFTPDPAHGGDVGLEEMERVCAIGGRVVIVWPNRVEWLLERGYIYQSFPGHMALAFDSLEEAIELAQIFYPDAVDEIQRRGDRTVPYETVGTNPPRDLAWKAVAD
ncbi:MAG: methyltransferase domain-containing protein [Chloroflexi bacterium]|nr:MAG: methyltransferase domain-containing protein [Chloroflexota bacterium]